MAIWQFDVLFVPRGTTVPIQDGDAWALPLLPEKSVVEAHAFLSEHFGQPWQMCEGILVFGPENGNRIEAVVDEAGDAELSARIDARLESSAACELLSGLAHALDCSLFSPELGSLIDPGSDALIAALMKSQAWIYALDPAEALRRAVGGELR
jgi:hypothetical protein